MMTGDTWLIKKKKFSVYNIQSQIIHLLLFSMYFSRLNGRQRMLEKFQNDGGEGIRTRDLGVSVSQLWL